MLSSGPRISFVGVDPEESKDELTMHFKSIAHFRSENWGDKKQTVSPANKEIINNTFIFFEQNWNIKYETKNNRPKAGPFLSNKKINTTQKNRLKP